MSGSVIQVELVSPDLNLEFTDRLSHTLLNRDPGIDDPVKDTGLAPLRGDLQMCDEFACLVNLICMEHGDFR